MILDALAKEASPSRALEAMEVVRLKLNFLSTALRIESEQLNFLSPKATIGDVAAAVEYLDQNYFAH